ncbi:MAG: hypothetical protein ACFCBW_16160 [Candidatus Competibacterales bacterium]
MKMQNVMLAVLLSAGTVMSLSAQAGDNQRSSFTFRNVSGATVMVESFNSGDGVRAIPFNQKAVGNGSQASLECGTNDGCQSRVAGKMGSLIRVPNGATVTYDGQYFTYR